MTTDLLAGPILRSTTQKCICVWLATDKKRDLTLEIIDRGTGNVIGCSKPIELESSRVQLGTGLFVYLLKAYPIEDKDIKNFSTGKLYCYSLLDKQQGKPLDLNAEGVTYDNQPYPIFHIPGSLKSLLHGSCRKPHGAKGQDCLVVGDSILKDTYSNIAGRPDLLLLTGDQIYADDVDASLLKMITDQAGKILGHQESLPRSEYGKEDKPPVIPSTIKLGGRMDVLKECQSGFSSQEAGNHLMGFGEFAAMYLYVFGNAQGWKIPTRSENEADRVKVNNKQQAGINVSSDPVSDFAQDLGKVRRLLANIPTYMIFDDHDVTDDWNITGNWYDTVRTSPLGRRIVSNALAAYWAFQDWGNNSDNIDTDMINAIKKYVNKTEPDFANDELYDFLTWKHRGWGFSINTYPPIIAIDSRTQRQSDNPYYPPRLLDKYGLDGLRLEWLKLKSNKDENPLIDETTCPIFIATTPVFGFAPLEHILRLLLWFVSHIENLLLIKILENYFGKKGFLTKKFVYEKDAETWTANLDGYTDFLDTLLHKVNVAHCVFLYGGIHYSFTAIGTYTSTNIASNAKKTLDSYQLTSSSLRNEPGTLQKKALSTIERTDEGFINWSKIRKWFTTNLFFYRTWKSDYELLKLENQGQKIYSQCNLGEVVFKDGLPINHKLWHTKDSFVEYKISPNKNSI